MNEAAIRADERARMERYRESIDDLKPEPLIKEPWLSKRWYYALWLLFIVELAEVVVLCVVR